MVCGICASAVPRNTQQKIKYSTAGKNTAQHQNQSRTVDRKPLFIV
jgi:hypothetical protein